MKNRIPWDSKRLDRASGFPAGAMRRKRFAEPVRRQVPVWCEWQTYCAAKTSIISAGCPNPTFEHVDVYLSFVPFEI